MSKEARNVTKNLPIQNDEHAQRAQVGSAIIQQSTVCDQNANFQQSECEGNGTGAGSLQSAEENIQNSPNTECATETQKIDNGGARNVQLVEENGANFSPNQQHLALQSANVEAVQTSTRSVINRRRKKISQ